MGFEHIPQWQAYDQGGRRKYVSSTERTAFLNLAEQLEPAAGAFCRVLVYVGCRVSEALALTRQQLDLDASTLTIRTLKRRRLHFRIVHIPRALAAELAALSVSADGRFWRMHRTTAWRTVKRLMQAADIAGPMSCPRGLRHGYGVRAASANVPIRTLAKWMGHANTSTTSIYTDVVGSEERSFAARMW